MAQFVEAVYTNGVLKPKEELGLREAQRVRLIIEALDGDADRGEARRTAAAPGGDRGDEVLLL